MANRPLLNAMLNVFIDEAVEDVEMVCGNVDDEEEEDLMLRLAVGSKKKTPTRILNYVEETVPNYSEQEFKEHFRMKRGTFESISEWLEEAGTEKTMAIPMDHKLLMTIWTLGNQESFRGIGDRFGMNKGTAHYCFFEICQLLTKLSPQVITWPSLTEAYTTMEAVEERWGFPGVVGAIDGCHIQIKNPEENPKPYWNRNKYPSIVLQGLCDDKLQFRDINVGWPGSVHDARVYRNSRAMDWVENGGLPPNSHILGDSAYPLRVGLLTPYRDNGHLSAIQRLYNTAHSKARVMIERAFGLLKGKFRRLKYLDMSRLDMVPQVVTAACVLHNLIIDCEGIDEDEIEEEEEDLEDEINEERLLHHDAVAKRNRIANEL